MMFYLLIHRGEENIGFYRFHSQWLRLLDIYKLAGSELANNNFNPYCKKDFAGMPQQKPTHF